MSSKQLDVYVRGQERFAMTETIPSTTVSLTTATQPQTAHEIDSTAGDVVGFLIEVTSASLAGTLSGSEDDIAAIFHKIGITGPDGDSIWSGVRGQDLDMIARFRGEGILNAPPALANSAQSFEIFIPWDIENKDLPADMNVTVEAYDTLDSGATGGSVTYRVKALHRPSSPAQSTLRVQRQDLQTVNGTGYFQSSLLDNKIVQDLYVKTTQSNVDSFGFTADGSRELEEIYIEDLVAFDDYLLPGQHVADELALPMSPFVKTTATRFRVVASAAQNLSLFQIFADPQNS